MAGSINKVIYGGQVLIDLTGDTVDAGHLLTGVTAHDRSGAVITGTLTYDADTSDATAGAAELLKDKTAYVGGSKVTGAMPNNGAATGVLTTKAQAYTIPQGYHDGSGKVGIDAAEQAKIVGDNIRAGIMILGVTGTMTGTEDVKAEAKTVIPAASEQTVTPDSAQGYNYISQVVVAAIPYAETENAAGGKTVAIG